MTLPRQTAPSGDWKGQNNMVTITLTETQLIQLITALMQRTVLAEPEAGEAQALLDSIRLQIGHTRLYENDCPGL